MKSSTSARDSTNLTTSASETDLPPATLNLPTAVLPADGGAGAAFSPPPPPPPGAAFSPPPPPAAQPRPITAAPSAAAPASAMVLSMVLVRKGQQDVHHDP